MDFFTIQADSTEKKMTSRSLKSALLSRERFIFKIANFRYGSLFDISSAGVLFYVSFHYCVLPCPGGGPGQGVTEVRHPSAFIFIHFHSFSDFHMLNIFKCSLPDTTQINQHTQIGHQSINQSIYSFISLSFLESMRFRVTGF